MSRFDYVKYDASSTETQELAKVMVENLESLVDRRLKAGRTKALVMTKLEECYMWIGKAIRDDQIARGGSDKHLPDRSCE